jgi:hypothetical protein
MFLKLVLSVVLVLVFVWFFVIPVAKSKVIRADREGFEDAGSISTGLINVGDVGIPPGHITLYNNGVIVSTVFLGPNAERIAKATANGKYILTVKDETGQTASTKITDMGSGGFYYVIYNSDSTDSTIPTKFAKSKQLAISVGISQQEAPKAPEPPQLEVDLNEYISDNYNPLSQAIDSTIPNFAVEPTGIESDPNLTDIEYINKYNAAASGANKQIHYAIANPTIKPMVETVPPVNPLVRKAKMCESLKGRASCSSLSDAKYSDCGVCLKSGTQYDGSNPGSFIGGLLSLKNQRIGSIAPTVGQCPPGMFYVDAQACETAAKTLNCSEAAPSAGRTAEGLKIPIAMCPLSDRIPDPKLIGQGLADGNLEVIAGAKAIVTAATASNNYDAWLQMLTTYYNVATKEGGTYIKNLMNSPFGTALQQSGVITIVGNPSASLLYPAYQTAYQGYMAATTG